MSDRDKLMKVGNGVDLWTKAKEWFAAKAHSHTKSQITDFPASMPASDVQSWAKAASKPTYTASEVGAAATGHTHSAATGSAAGLMSAADKAKLDGVAAGANAYVHPSNTSRVNGLYKIIVDALGHVTGATAVAKNDITGLGIPAQDTTYSPATGSAAGLMSAEDKAKLDGVAAGANAYVHPSNTARASGLYKIIVDALGHVTGATAVAKNDITGLGIPAQDTTYSPATSSANGLMSAADKAKLDGVAAGANAYVHPSNTSRASGLYKIIVDALGHVTGATAAVKDDITGLGVPAQDTTYQPFVGATDTMQPRGAVDGVAGLVPAPQGLNMQPTGVHYRYLCADGTWREPNEATDIKSGLMSSADKQRLDELYAAGSSGAGGGGNVDWSFLLVTEQPIAVTSNTIIAIVNSTSVSCTVSSVEPSYPETGRVWFHVDDIGDRRLMTSGACEFWLYGAYQWNSTEWVPLETYMSFLGKWEKLDGLPPAGTTLDNCTWAQIDAIGRAGKAADYFCVGDRKSITLPTGEVTGFRIIDFAHDDLADGSGKAAMTFDLENCLNQQYRFNAAATNVGSWGGSEIRATLGGTIYEALPSELKAVIKTVFKTTSAGNKSSAVVTISDKLFLPSEVEIYGTIANSFAGEGTAYAYYTTATRRIKTVGGVAGNWGTRTPDKSYATRFVNIGSSGTVTMPAANVVTGISYCFCI